MVFRISPDLFFGHSFHIGTATNASRKGIPDHLIKLTVRWSSQDYQLYIRNNLQDLHNVQSSLLLGDVFGDLPHPGAAANPFRGLPQIAASVHGLSSIIIHRN